VCVIFFTGDPADCAFLPLGVQFLNYAVVVEFGSCYLFGQAEVLSDCGLFRDILGLCFYLCSRPKLLDRGKGLAVNLGALMVVLFGNCNLRAAYRAALLWLWAFGREVKKEVILDVSGRGLSLEVPPRIRSVELMWE
jgi:hypothetical protein